MEDNITTNDFTDSLKFLSEVKEGYPDLFPKLISIIYHVQRNGYKRIMSYSEVADMLGMELQTIVNHVNKGNIPVRRLKKGKKVIFYEDLIGSFEKVQASEPLDKIALDSYVRNLGKKRGRTPTMSKKKKEVVKGTV